MKAPEPAHTLQHHQSTKVSSVVQRDEGMGIEHAEWRADIFMGPLPSPHILAEYHKLDPNLMYKIVELAERQAEDRRNKEWKVYSHDIALSYIGMVCAFLIAISGFVLTGYLAKINSPVVSAIVACLDIGMLVAVFIHGKYDTKQLPAKSKSSASLTKKVNETE